MWHASIGLLPMAQQRVSQLVARARQELDGVGDATRGEWWGGDLGENPDTYAWKLGQSQIVHLRRRLSEAEEATIGPVIDIRGTPEFSTRVAALRRSLKPFIPEVADLPEDSFV